MFIQTEQFAFAAISNVDVAQRSVKDLQGNYSIPNFIDSISSARVDPRTHLGMDISTYEFTDAPFSEGFLLEHQPEGGFVVISFRYPGATGQGETEDEAIKDIQDAIELLKEEEMNPSGDVEWPMEFR
ncbi:type II toxin-antitoxin system HicB family antitoxin [bacterium]|nr:type II toxin-antitoxin system HicB family antitoxin [bacterium]